jgi:hypothetical protein
MQSAWQSLRQLALFGKITAAVQYPVVEWDKLSKEEQVFEWVLDAYSLVKNLGVSAIQDSSRDQNVSDCIAFEGRRCFAALVDRCYGTYQEVPVIDSSVLELASKSLKDIEAKSLPDLDFYKRAVSISLARKNIVEAGEYATRALQIGGKDELFYYATTLSARSKSEDSAAAVIAGYSGPITIREFQDLKTALTAWLPQTKAAKAAIF